MTDPILPNATALAGDRRWTESQRAELETEVLERSIAHRHELLHGALSAAQAATLLGTALQITLDRVENGTLLSATDQGELRFPRWQFDTDEPDGVVPGLVATIQALDVSALAKIAWLTRANCMLDGVTPLELLKARDAERVVALARAVGVS